MRLQNGSGQRTLSRGVAPWESDTQPSAFDATEVLPHWSGMPLAGGVVLLCLSLPLPGGVLVSCPLIDLEFCHTEVQVIPLLKGVFGGEPFHRIPTRPRAQESGWHAVKHPVRGLRCCLPLSRPLLTPTRGTSLMETLQEFLDHLSAAHHSEALGGAWW